NTWAMITRVGMLARFLFRHAIAYALTKAKRRSGLVFSFMGCQCTEASRWEMDSVSISETLSHSSGMSGKSLVALKIRMLLLRTLIISGWRMSNVRELAKWIR